MRPICLITPPSPFLLDQRVFISLGILKVAAVLERQGYDVEHLDLSGIANYMDVVQEHARRVGPRIYGLTATTPQMPAAANIARYLNVQQGSRVILGGPHVTLLNAARKGEQRRGIVGGRADRAMEYLSAMFRTLVCGDGELAVFEAIRDDAPSLIDGDNPASHLWMTNELLNDQPLPARHLVDLPSYHYTIDGKPATPLIAQYGCSLNCFFCGGRNSPMLRRIRNRSTENVVAELVHLYHTYGFKAAMFFDDELNINRQMIPLMHAIRWAGEKLCVEWSLRGFIKSQLFTDEQAHAMYGAGFRWILVGFESGSPRMLHNMNKKATREQNSRCLQIAQAHGLKVKALMSLGHAGESAETVEETREWLLHSKPDDFDVTILTLYPGSPYWDESVPADQERKVWTYTSPKTGDRLHSYDVDFTREVACYKGIPGDYRSFVFTPDLSAEDLVRLRDDLESDVRAKLDIPYNLSAAAIRFEHSMGQGLPQTILRSTDRS